VERRKIAYSFSVFISSRRMQVKTRKMDSFGVSGGFLAQIDSSARPGFSPQNWACNLPAV
jgi:hypothetical protein